MAAGAAALVGFAAPSVASGATVGQHAPTSEDVNGCGGHNIFVTPTSDYTVPQTGLLTSWSVRGATGDGGDPDQLELKIIEPLGGDTYRVVAQDPIRRSIALNTLNTFEVRIPVEEGQLLALWAPEGEQPCDYSPPDPGGTSWDFTLTEEPGVGDDVTLNATNESAQINVSARLLTKKCKGKAPTVIGTRGHDTLVGTDGKDVIVGFSGRDTITGLGAKDRLCGNAGRDKLRGSAGDDILKGGLGDDRLKGAGGFDKCLGGPGFDVLRFCEVER